MNKSSIANYMIKGRRAHLVGIGGVSMCPLAEVMRGVGIVVSGSDMSDSKMTSHLKSTGFDVKIGHSAQNIDGAEFLVRTAAAHDDNPEIEAARALGIPVFERAEAWGHIMKEYSSAVCVAGTHGKTSTTSMASQIFLDADLDPTIMLGGTLPIINSGYRVGGKKDVIVLESCEYFNSFLNFAPTISIILNIEEDHLDFFSGLDDIKESFRKFACLVPPKGIVIANADDENTMEAISGIERNVLTFGIGAGADVRAMNISYYEGYPVFDVVCKGRHYAHIELIVPGKHNIMNALAATAAAYALGIAPRHVERALASFGGAGRRFEKKGEYSGAVVYDDYAHHPGEISALMSAASGLRPSRIICVFQPHTYTRTKALFDDFAKELAAPDLLILADIYAAREKNTVGISSKELSEAIPGSVYLESFDEIVEYLKGHIAEGDIVLTVGAGDVYRVGEMLLEQGVKAPAHITYKNIG